MTDSHDQQPLPDRRLLARSARFGAKAPVSSRRGLAVTSNPIPATIAIDVLAGGGNACDAALAAALAQTVVEPHMSTITGVLTLLYLCSATGEISYLNGSMNAPLAPLPGFGVADMWTARGVAVPGFWAAFEAALARHGSWPRSALMAPAIDLADNGFEIYPFLYGEMFAQCDTIGRSAQGREVYMPEGMPGGASTSASTRSATAPCAVPSTHWNRSQRLGAMASTHRARPVRSARTTSPASRACG